MNLSTDKIIFSTSLKSALFIGILGSVAWITGAAFIFPSLGPTAYLLAFDNKLAHSARVVIGGHFCGVTGGLISYFLIVDPHNIQLLTEPLSAAGFQLAAGSAVALGITVLMMLYLNVSHPPACATTLIISLGFLPTLYNSFIIIVAVSILYIVYRLFQAVLSPVFSRK